MTAFQAGLILLRMEDYPKANELSGVDVSILATLFSFAAEDDRPVAFPSAAKIAARSRYGVRTVERTLKHLEEVGVISGEHRHRRPTRWSLDAHFLKTSGGVTETPDPKSSRGGKRSTRTATRTETSVRETEGIRQSGGQHPSERRSTSATVADQCTEVSSGTKWRNCTDVKKDGSTSEAGLRSARPGSSAPPSTDDDGDQSTRTTGSTKPTRKSGSTKPTRKPGSTKPTRKSGSGSTPPPPPAWPDPGVRVEPDPPRCCHGVVRGWTVTFGKHGKPVCPQCTALAPNPDTDNFNQWLAKHPGLDAYLRNNEVACAEPITEKTVYQVARRMFHSVTKTQPYTVTPPSLIPLKRRMKAYAVDHAETGRVRQLMSTNGGNHHGSTVVPGTTPTQPQGADP